MHLRNRWVADLFPTQFAQACKILTNGATVIVQGEYGGGKTLFSVAIKEYLRSRSIVIWSEDGSTHNSSIPFRTVTGLLVQAGDEDILTQRFPSAAAADISFKNRLRSCVEANQNRRVCLVIDNFHLIDSASANLILYLLENTDICALITAAPTEQWNNKADPMLVHKIAAACLKLPQLGFEKTMQYMSILLPGKLELSLVGQIHAITAGNMGLIKQVVKSGRIEEQIVQQDGVWRSKSDTLWNNCLEEIVKYHLERIPLNICQVLLEVGARGPLLYDSYCQITDAGTRFQLEQQKLVKIENVARGTISVEVAQPIIAEYARRNAGLIGHHLVPQSKVNVRQIWADLHKTRDKKLCVQQLSKAWGSTRGHAPLEDIFYTLHDLPEADEKTETRLAVLRSFWEATKGQGRDTPTEQFDALVTKYPGSKNQLKAYELLQNALWDHANPTYQEELLDNDYVSIVAKAFLLLVDLRPREATVVLNDLPPGGEEDALLAPFLPLTKALSLYMVGRWQNAIEIASHAVFSAKKRMDEAGYALGVLAYSLVAGGQGLVREALGALGGALACSNADFAHRGVNLALGHLAIKLMGECGLLQSVGVLAGGTDRLVGPLPFMDGRYVHVLSHLRKGSCEGRVRAGKIASEIARDALERGYVFAAVEALHFALLSNPTSELVEQYEEIFHSRGIFVRDDFCRLVRLALQDKWAEVRALVEHWCEIGTVRDVATLICNLQATSRLETSVDLDATVSHLKNKFPTVATLFQEKPVNDDMSGSLSPRETEIVELAASKTNREVAAQLGLSVRTVENHIYNAVRKTGAKGRNELFQRWSRGSTQ